MTKISIYSNSLKENFFAYHSFCDWEEVIKSYRERLEKETLERKKRIEKREIKEKVGSYTKNVKNS